MTIIIRQLNEIQSHMGIPTIMIRITGTIYGLVCNFSCCSCFCCSGVPAPPAPAPVTSFSAPTTPSRSDLLGQIRAGKALRSVSTPRPTNDNQDDNDQAQLPDLSSMRDSDKMSMMNHIKTLLDAR